MCECVCHPAQVNTVKLRVIFPPSPGGRTLCATNTLAVKQDTLDLEGGAAGGLAGAGRGGDVGVVARVEECAEG